jgi:opacity protein-like surface antigen
MKTTIRLITVTGAAFIMSVSSASASDWSDNLYLGADAGGAFQQNAVMTQSTLSGRRTTTFNPGIRGDITVGYNLDKSWAVELESGIICNSIDKIGVVSLSSIDQSFDTYSVPILANVVYKVPTGNAWTPYFGVGVGGLADSVDFRSGTTHYYDSTFTFAYQAKAGVDYALTKNISVGIAYKFLGTPNQRFYLSGINDHLKLDGIYTHAVVASFTWNF